MSETGITVITPKSLGEAQELSKVLGQSLMVPEALRGKVGDVLAVIMTGAELGLAPMQSLRAIDIIKGKPSLKAETMVALVRARRDVCEYLRIVESTDKVATYEAKRIGDPSPTRMSFSIEDAQRAGLLSNGTWRAYPAALLRARCGSAICKAMFSDVTLGLYDPEELTTQAAPAPVAVERQVNAAPITVAPPKPSPQDAQFVPASPPRARIVDESGADIRPAPKTVAEAVATVEKVAERTPWEAIWVEAQARSMDEKALRAWLKSAGATSKNATTFDMVAAFVAAHPLESTPF